MRMCRNQQINLNSSSVSSIGVIPGRNTRTWTALNRRETALSYWLPYVSAPQNFSKPMWGLPQSCSMTTVETAYLPVSETVATVATLIQFNGYLTLPFFLDHLILFGFFVF